jgi:hypothetical protein
MPEEAPRPKKGKRVQFH